MLSSRTGVPSNRPPIATNLPAFQIRPRVITLALLALATTLALTTTLVLTSSPAFAAMGDVLRSIPCAGANTSDIAWANGVLYQVIFSPADQRNIYKLDPADGHVLSIIPYSGTSPQGLAHDGHNLWQGDLAGHRIYKLDPETGEVRDQFAAPDASGQPLGLGWDGTHLWIADSRSPEKIWEVDSVGVVVGQIPAPGTSPYGLDWALGYIWVSDNSTSGSATIYRLDPADGSILQSCACPDNGGSPNGIAHDGDNLWVAVNSTDLIYQVDDGLVGSGVAYPVASRSGPTFTLDHARTIPTSRFLEVGFTLPLGGPARLSLFDVAGRSCGVSVDDVWAPGQHEVRISTAGLASGIVFVRLSADGTARTHKVALVR